MADAPQLSLQLVRLAVQTLDRPVMHVQAK